jgi:uncharacterized repeat protein (TIGR03943 family)
MSRNSYFIEQLCTIGVAGAYAVMMVVILLQGVLQGLVTTWIQVMVLIGGGVLMALLILRAIHLWRASGQMEAHHHDHAHGHPHAHDHSHADDHGHEHGWSPWRYAVLLFPLMLFLLFPFKELIADYLTRHAPNPAEHGEEGMGELFALAQVSFLSQGPAGGIDPAPALLVAVEESYYFAEQEVGGTGKVEARTDIGQLELIAARADQREQWSKYRRIEVQGLYSPLMRGGQPDGKMFQIVRFRIACCLSDARPASVMAASRQQLEVPAGSWVTVTGRVEFKQTPDGRWRPVIRVFRASDVKPTRPPANPYLS